MIDILYAFRQNLNVQALAHSNNSLGNRAIAFIMRQVADERLIDLQEVDVQLVYSAITEQGQWITYNPTTKNMLTQFQKDISAIYKDVSKDYDLDYTHVGLSVEALHSGLTWSMGNELEKDGSTGLYLGKFSIASAVKFPLSLSIVEHMLQQNIQLDDSFI